MTISVGIGSTSAIPDFATLKTTVSDWLDRNDLDAKIPTFVQMAEAMFNRELRTPDMEKEVTFSTTTEITSLPADYLAMRSIYIEGSPDRPLRGMAPTAVRQEFDGSTGIPVAYCLVSGGLTLIPPPSSSTTLTMDYFAQIEGLSDATPYNWLLTKHPDAYLYATLFNAEVFLDNAARAAQWKGQLDELIAKINKEARNDRFGAGPLVPNVVVQVPGARC
jgi:hypothetical protein